jgi:LysR family transcriptional regulator, carnitine catabolism transcriptional activator
MNLSERHLKAFLAIARLGNFTRAAIELHLSQSALTVQIQQLEESLGVRLFDRNRRKVALTAVAQGLLEPIERIASDIDTLLTRTQEIAALKRGVVGIAALPSVAGGFLPVTIRKFALAYPGISVRIHDVVAQKIEDLVDAGEVDIGIGSLVSRRPGVTHVPLLVDTLCVFMPGSHALAVRQSLALKDLSGQPVVVTGKDSSVRKLFERALVRSGAAVQVAFETHYMSTALALARAGLGLAVLPESAADPIIEGGLVRVPLRSLDLKRQISIITKTGRSLTPPAAKFVSVLRERFQVSKRPV